MLESVAGRGFRQQSKKTVFLGVRLTRGFRRNREPPSPLGAWLPAWPEGQQSSNQQSPIFEFWSSFHNLGRAYPIG